MLKQKLISIINAIKKLPKITLVGVPVLLGLLIIGIVALWPQTITYSYQQAACTEQLTVAPGLFKSKDSSDYQLKPGKIIEIAGITLASRELCVTATATPQPGDHTVSWSLGGLLGKKVTIKTAPHPVASVAKLNNPVPVSRPLELSLNVPDDVFQYHLQATDKTVVCENQSRALRCDISQLQLQQGTAYEMVVSRYFKDQKVSTLAKKQVETLSATTVIGSSIKPNGVVYDKPKSMQIDFDKPIVSAKTELVKIDGDSRKVVPSTLTAEGAVSRVEWPDDLDRSASYELAVKDVVAQDGSSLIDPYIVPFKVSGGPKVSNVSVGSSQVPLGATIIVTFDQPLSDKQDIAKGVSVTGGLTVAGRQGDRLLISTANVPRCGDVAIALSDELQSKYDVTGGSVWKFAARMSCKTVETIGYSAKGRAITAYTLGNGPTKVVYTGAIHGNEVSTKALMMKWIDELDVNSKNIPADKSVVVIPTINPDGVASGTRTNGNNVDLNRNFGTADWKKDITTVTNAPFPGGGGSAAMSEPETKAMATFIGRLQPRLVLSYHSIGGLLVANQAGISSAYARTYTNLSGYANTTGSDSTFEYAISGTADDYYAERLGVPSIVIELGSHSYHQFERNQKAMWAMLN